MLELVARGLSNAAICDELHLSIKTVEPAVGSILIKLGLHADSASNRRVLAALRYLGAGGGPTAPPGVPQPQHRVTPAADG